MKKNILLLVLAMLFSVASALAQGGTTGPLTWNFNATSGTLTISGEGDMPDYSYPDYAPWTMYYESIQTIVIEVGVTSIGNNAFSGCYSTTSTTISNSVTSIGYSAFAHCYKLTSIAIPNSVTYIGDAAFCACPLTSITIPNGVTSIGNRTFMYCALTSIAIPNSVTSIGNEAFYWCESLTSITIPNSVTNIGNKAFFWCTSLKSVTISNGVKSIGNQSFEQCRSLTSVTIPNSVTSIGDRAFFWCLSLKSATLSENITSIKNSTFSYCENLTSITIPNGVTNIGTYAFTQCKSLTSVTIPNSVTGIGDMAFYECRSLISITNLNPIPVAINFNVFEGVLQSACALKVPTNAVLLYKNANVWKEFNIIGSGFLINSIANNSQYGYTTGDGLYEENTTATVIATTYSGYKFVNWTKDGIEVSKNNSYSFTVTEDVKLVANFESEVGIDETDNYPSVRVYPNPTRGELIISLPNPSEGGAYETWEVKNIEVCDVFGRSVYIAHPPFRGGLEGLNISVLPSGIYFMRIRTGNGVVTRKIIKN